MRPTYQIFVLDPEKSETVMYVSLDEASDEDDETPEEKSSAYKGT